MNNPPAFPVAWDFGNEAGINDGMTLRDYFAAQVIQGYITELGYGRNDKNDKATRRYVALAAYALADAMLEARAE